MCLSAPTDTLADTSIRHSDRSAAMASNAAAAAEPSATAANAGQTTNAASGAQPDVEECYRTLLSLSLPLPHQSTAGGVKQGPASAAAPSAAPAVRAAPTLAPAHASAPAPAAVSAAAPPATATVAAASAAALPVAAALAPLAGPSVRPLMPAVAAPLPASRSSPLPARFSSSPSSSPKLADDLRPGLLLVHNSDGGYSIVVLIGTESKSVRMPDNNASGALILRRHAISMLMPSPSLRLYVCVCV